VGVMATMSVAEFRKLLGKPEMSDKEVQTIMNNATIFINRIFDKVLNNGNS
jgi:hypothetical protein